MKEKLIETFESMKHDSLKKLDELKSHVEELDFIINSLKKL